MIVCLDCGAPVVSTEDGAWCLAERKHTFCRVGDDDGTLGVLLAEWAIGWNGRPAVHPEAAPLAWAPWDSCPITDAPVPV